ncbi:hypothetical protein BT69DRAFT_1208045, partial [Atractiella rhizophila]
HKFLFGHGNIKPESLWSFLRRYFLNMLEFLLQWAVENGIYDPEEVLDIFLFRALVMPWIQQILDDEQARYNNTKKRFQKHKALPQGHAPNTIYDHADRFGG